MGKPTGFMEFERADVVKRPVSERTRDFREFELPVASEKVARQAARCMDCGIPFCNTGCPLENLIPEWNDHVYHGRWHEAALALHATNNFPEFTGRVCPAPCEAACVLAIHDEPVSIKLVERAIADRAFDEGGVVPISPRARTGRKVAVVGSGPAGLAAAQELNRAGHQVIVYEKADRVGGLLTYGIPDFKLEKSLVARRVQQLAAEGVTFETNVDVGRALGAAELRRRYDAVCLTIGSRAPRDLLVPGRELCGVHFAMDFLEQQNRRVAGEVVPDDVAILARGKHVAVIGGGDTGSDCIGTAHRQGALSVTSFEILPRPPRERSPSTPWPMWPLMLRTSSSHEEGGNRDFSVSTERLSGDSGCVKRLHFVRVAFEGGQLARVAGSEFEVPADLVLLAMGFVHAEHGGLVNDLGVELDGRGNVRVGADFMSSVPGVFAAGDCQRGQSLVVWAIADGRRAARGIDHFLSGKAPGKSSLG
jgi:glutamate synthase (NADPH) small chain